MSLKSINISESDGIQTFSFIRRNSPKGAGPYNTGTGAGFEGGDYAITGSSSIGLDPSTKNEFGHWIFYSERTIRSSKKSKNWDRIVGLECGGMEINGKGTAKIYLYKKDSSCGKTPGIAGKKWLIGKGKYKEYDPITENNDQAGLLGINRIDTTSTRNGKKTNRVDYVMRLLDDTGDHVLTEMKLKKGFFAPTEKQSNKWGIEGELTTPFGVLAGNLDVI